MALETSKRNTFAGLTTAGIAGALLLVSTSIAPAAAAPAEPGPYSSVDQALSSLDLLASPPTAPAAEIASGVPAGTRGDVGASLSPEAGLSIQNGDAIVSITPGSPTAAGAMSESGALVYETDDAYDYAFTGPDSAFNAGYAVIHDASAPTEYRFDVDVDGAPAQLELVGDSIVVKNGAGGAVNTINPAWALDAVGRSVATSYTVEGNTVVQHVEHEGATYPVVADPRSGCNAVWCTVMLNRTETKTASQTAFGATGLLCGTMTAVFPPLAAVCAAYGAAFWVAATQAVNSGKCVGMRGLTIGGSWHPVVERC